MNTKTMNAYALKGKFEEETEFSNLLIHGELLGAYGPQTTFENCTFQDIKISGSIFDGALFKNCSFYGCDIKCVDFTNCKFENCTFTSRFEMCDFTTVDFTDCTIRKGYMLCCHMDETLFKNTLFDGIWAGKLHIISPVIMENVQYTMGGARCDEVDVAKKNFMSEMGIKEMCA